MMALRPIIIDADKIILGGNMRFAALQKLGYEEVPEEWVKRAEDLTDDERRRFIIVDNAGFGENDWELLANEWDVKELEGWGMEIPGFAISPDGMSEDFTLPDGGKVPFQQMTFTISDEQAATVKGAIEMAKESKEYKKACEMGNENSNGNALYLICKQWVGQKK